MTIWLTLALLLFVLAIVHASMLEGWRRRILGGGHGSIAPDPRAGIRITLVVPARNAAATIIPLLQDLYAQRHPKELCEVIVVDDGSEDGTAEAVRGLMRTWPQLKLIQLANGQGKKRAIEEAVSQATGTLILLTDADARCGPGRVPALIAHWSSSRSDLVLMPVHTKDGEGGAAWLQREEQLAFQGATAGSALDGTPLLANGANLAFTREAFFALRGFEGDRWASGDDMLLLKRMRRVKRPVSYLLHADAMVTVAPEPDWSGFLAQRLRWAGKMRAYHNTAGFVVGIFALLFPWAMVVLAASATRNVSIGAGFLYTWSFILGAAVLWMVPIVRLVATMKRTFGSEKPAGLKSTLSSVAAITVFVNYAPIIAILSLFIRPRWKGRRV